MIPLPLPASAGTGFTRIYLACGATDMRKGFDGLAVLVQQVLEQSPHSGALFAFRGKRGDLVKLLWYDGQGLYLFSKRMDRGRFVWPSAKTGKVSLTAAQLSMLLDDKRYGLPDPDWENDSLFAAKNIKLKTLLDRGVHDLLYTYDMGDNWEHVVTVEAVEDGEPGTKYPRYVDGERRAPPEDVGGTPGFEAFLDAIAKPRSRDHKEAVQWHRGCYGEDFVPDKINELVAKLRIGDIAKRRAAGKASFAKRKSS